MEGLRNKENDKFVAKSNEISTKTILLVRFQGLKVEIKYTTIIT